MRLIAAVVLGFVIDAFLGDPEWLWHPVIAIGKLISRAEKMLRRILPDSSFALHAGGVLLWIIVCGISFLVPFAVLSLAGRIHPALTFILETIFCYQIIARLCLSDAGRKVTVALEESLESGRRAVGMYVGRDTSALSEEGVIKATVETIAENTSDGVIAPLLFLLIGGAPLGFLYKAVNTLDSMVGYHNDCYEYFGRFSARMDDLFNYIPARVTALCMVAASPFCGLNGSHAWKILCRDAKKHKSPNSGYPESACAGALDVQLAGDAVYFGKLVKKATLGDPIRPIERADIVRSARLMTAASVLALMLFSAVRAFLFML